MALLFSLFFFVSAVDLCFAAVDQDKRQMAIAMVSAAINLWLALRKRAANSQPKETTRG